MFDANNLFKNAMFVENHAYDDHHKKRDNVLNAIMPIGPSGTALQNNKVTVPSETSQGLRKRDLIHVHLQSTNLYGNSTDLQYFYVDVYMGSHR